MARACRLVVGTPVLFFAVAVSTQAQVVMTFANATPITITDGAVAAPNPSTINVSGLTGAIVKVRVGLLRVSHANPVDLNIWLKAPTGSVVLMGRVPASVLNDTQLEFDDCAPRFLWTYSLSATTPALPSGRYRPGSHPIATPADIANPTSTFPMANLAGLNGPVASIGANGEWDLFVRDASGNGVGGSIAGGWRLTFYTQPTTPISNTISLQSMPCSKPDYDGDGRSDIAVYRPTTGEWFILQSATGTGMLVSWGAPSSTGLGDVAVPGDYDGDGRTDIAVYRQTTGTWYILYSFGGSAAIDFGAPAGSGIPDTPVPGDYDGDGIFDLAIYRPTTGEWMIRRSSLGGVVTQTWGNSSFGDYPARR